MAKSNKRAFFIASNSCFSNLPTIYLLETASTNQGCYVALSSLSPSNQAPLCRNRYSRKWQYCCLGIGHWERKREEELRAKIEWIVMILSDKSDLPLKESFCVGQYTVLQLSVSITPKYLPLDLVGVSHWEWGRGMPQACRLSHSRTLSSVISHRLSSLTFPHTLLLASVYCLLVSTSRHNSGTVSRTSTLSTAEIQIIIIVWMLCVSMFACSLESINYNSFFYRRYAWSGEGGDRGLKGMYNLQAIRSDRIHIINPMILEPLHLLFETRVHWSSARAISEKKVDLIIILHQ